MLQVGKGLSKSDRAQKLALQHWLEAVSMLYFNSFFHLNFLQIFLAVIDSVSLFLHFK